MVILLQTVGHGHAALPAWLRRTLALWVQARALYPLTLATACAFCLYGASDALSQCVAVVRSGNARDGWATRRVELDVHRLLRTGMTASFLSGFLAVFYFRWLDQALSPLGWSWAQGAGGGVRQLAEFASVAGKIGVDVGVYEPFYDILYITMQALLRGDGLTAARDEVSQKVLRVWRMAPRYWCACDAINFSVVPLRLRPLMNALFSVPWGMYISAVANQSGNQKQQQPERAAVACA